MTPHIKNPRRQATNHAAGVQGDNQPSKENQLITTPYLPNVTTRASQLDVLRGQRFVRLEFANVDQAQCEHCAEVDALTEARISSRDDQLHAETCLACAPGVAEEFATRTDLDITVEVQPTGEKRAEHTQNRSRK